MQNILDMHAKALHVVSINDTTSKVYRTGIWEWSDEDGMSNTIAIMGEYPTILAFPL